MLFNSEVMVASDLFELGLVKAEQFIVAFHADLFRFEDHNFVASTTLKPRTTTGIVKGDAIA